MPDQAYVFRKPQIAAESTPGTQVQPSRVLGSLEIAPSFNPDVQTFGPMGYLLDTVAATNREWTQIALKGIGVYDELPYFWASLISAGSVATPGGGTLTRDWTFNLNTSSPNTQKTYTYEVGDTVRASRGGGMQITEGSAQIDFEKGMQLSGSAIGQKMLDNKYTYVTISGGPPTTGTWSFTVGGQTASGLSKTITASALQTALEALSNVDPGDVVATGGPLGTSPITLAWAGQYAATAVPALSTADTFDAGDVVLSLLAPGASALALVPVLGSQMDYYITTSYAGLAGATALTRLFGYNIKLGNRAAPLWAMNTSNAGTYSSTVETKPSATLGFSVGADDTGMGYLANLRANTMIFVRAKATGPTIEGSFTYRHIIDAAVLLKKVNPIKDGGGLAQIDFEGVIANDPTWGQGLQVTVRNKLTAL